MMAVRRSSPTASSVASTSSIHFCLTPPSTSASTLALAPLIHSRIDGGKSNSVPNEKRVEAGLAKSQGVSKIRLYGRNSSLRSTLVPCTSTRRLLPLLSSTSLSSSNLREFSTSSQLRLKASNRLLSSSSASDRQRAPFEFLVGYAFAGKPRGGQESEPREKESESQEEDEEGEGEGDNSEERFKPKEIGFPPDSDIGRWRDSLLGGGEAGEDSLMCAGMGILSTSTSTSTSTHRSDSGTRQEDEDGPILEGGDVVLGVADGVGGWVENGIDPSLFSQALMFHATRKAAHHFACPDRVEDIATDGVSGSFSSLSLDSSNSSPSSTSNSSSNSSITSSSNASTNATSISSSNHPGSPLSLLQYAYDKVLEEDSVEAGSATACIVTLDSSKGVLRAANLGDSGFLILRQGAGINNPQTVPKEKRVIQNADLPSSSTRTISRGRRPSEGVYFASEPLQLGFNCPLQLAKLPKHLAQEGSISNVPDDSALWECRLRDGDIVLLGTDGLFDNVFQSEIVQLTRFIREKHHSAWIAKHGSKKSLSKGDESSKASSSSNSVITSTNPKPSTPTSSNLSSSDASSTSTNESPGDGDHLINDDLAEERAFIEVLAHNLVEYTRMCQFSQTKKSPFEREAERYGMRYPGGKVDDVAVCLALVKER